MALLLRMAAEVRSALVLTSGARVTSCPRMYRLCNQMHPWLVWVVPAWAETLELVVLAAFSGATGRAVSSVEQVAARIQTVREAESLAAARNPSNALPFSCKPAAELAPRSYTMSVPRD